MPIIAHFTLSSKLNMEMDKQEPLDFLKLFIGDQFLSEIVTETNIYALLTKMSMSYVTKVSISSVTNVSMSCVTIVSMSSVTNIPVLCDYSVHVFCDYSVHVFCDYSVNVFCDYYPCLL